MDQLVLIVVCLVIGVFLGSALTWLANRKAFTEATKREDLLKGNVDYLQRHASDLAASVKNFFNKDGTGAGTATQDSGVRGVVRPGS